MTHEVGHGLLVGLGLANEAVARQLLKRGWAVTVTDDTPTDSTRAAAGSLGLTLVEEPDPNVLADLVRGVDVVLPGPGVKLAHPIYGIAASERRPVWSEFELAARWDDRPIVAITGTNGKTTVTTLVTDMLRAAGRNAVAAGNNELPLVDALDTDADVFVVEASSFRLLHIETFRAGVATWLNFAEDHLDWHPTMDHYAASKERIWEFQKPTDTAIGNIEDGVVAAALGRAPGRHVTFGLHTGDYRQAGDGLLAFHETFAAVGDLPRRQPHDLANALAATATAAAGGAALDACRRVLIEFEGLPHRVHFVGDSGGVRFYDDSKATTPASVVAALAGFQSVVLIAGGRNKGLDLSVITREANRLRAVVAIGEAAEAVAAVFQSHVPVERAASMDEAVDRARRLARPGDVVLLSPACESKDWYRNYGERGDDFARAVREAIGTAP